MERISSTGMLSRPRARVIDWRSEFFGSIFALPHCGWNSPEVAITYGAASINRSDVGLSIGSIVLLGGEFTDIYAPRRGSLKDGETARLLRNTRTTARGLRKTLAEFLIDDQLASYPRDYLLSLLVPSFFLTSATCSP